MNSKVFWLVWKDLLDFKGNLISVSRSAPTMLHPNKESAVKEAKRLAALHPGNEFFVCSVMVHGSAKLFTVEYKEMWERKP